MLDYNPYLQGNPLMGNVTPEMQEAARQRAIFNAGAAMLGSAGRGESFVSGLSQAGQMYGGSLDQMMNEGLRYQSARQQQEHQKELMKQEAELAQKANETRIKAAQIGSAAGLAQAEMLRKQMEQQERTRKLNESIGSQILLGQVDRSAPQALRSQGYVLDPNNPLAAGAAASLNRRMSGINGPLSLEQQAKVAAQLPERERSAWLLQQNLMNPDDVRAAYPERFMQNPLGIMGSGEPPPEAAPIATPEQAKVNADIAQFNKQLSDIKAEVYGPSPWTPLLNPLAAMVNAPTGKKQLSKERVKEIRDKLTANKGLITQENQEEVQAILNRLEQEERGMVGFGTRAYQNLFR